MQPDTEQLSKVIGCLYDAALDPSKWPSVLEQLCDFVGGAAANIFWQDAATNSSGIFHSWGSSQDYEQLYHQEYADLNPYFPALAFVGVGKVISGGELIPHDEFHETRFYLEWVKPQRFIDVIGVNLDRTATTTAFLSIRRHEQQGFVDARMRRRFELLVPHVQRAVVIGNLLQSGRTTESAFKRVLEGTVAAVALVASDGKVIFANRTAEDYFANHHVMMKRHGALLVTDEIADRVLREAFMLAAQGDAALGVTGIHVPLKCGDGSSHIAHVLSLVSDGRRDETYRDAVAALFVRKITIASPSPLESIAAQFSLTPSELRVLAAVLNTSSVDDLAHRLGVGKATVKTHLNRLLAKTGSRRQADLVRLAAGFNTMSSES